MSDDSMSARIALLGEDHMTHAVRWRGSGVSWDGNDEVERRRALCSCGARIVVEIRTDVGPPTPPTDRRTPTAPPETEESAQ